VVKVTPPGTLRPTHATAASPPPPYEVDQSGDQGLDKLDVNSNEEGVTLPKDDRSLAMDVRVPQFWGSYAHPTIMVSLARKA
jgi:hypothetical protein